MLNAIRILGSLFALSFVTLSAPNNQSHWREGESSSITARMDTVPSSLKKFARVHQSNLEIPTDTETIVIPLSSLFEFSQGGKTYYSGIAKKAGVDCLTCTVFLEGTEAFASVTYYEKNDFPLSFCVPLSDQDFALVQKFERGRIVDYPTTFLIDQANSAYTSIFKSVNEVKNPSLRSSQVTYDDYTNSDGIIHEYVSTYLSEAMIGTRRCENRIVDVVPKSLFSSIGDYLCIGKEYGFYINTGADYLFPGDYVSDVFVFDIQYISPMIGYPSHDDTGVLRIEPLFQYRYATRLRQNHTNFSLDYATSEDSIVVTHLHSTSSNYYLANPELAISVENANEANYGEASYSTSTDGGAFFESFEVKGKFINFNSAPNYNPDSLKQFANASNVFSTLVGVINVPLGLSFAVLSAVLDNYAAEEVASTTFYNSTYIYEKSFGWTTSVSEHLWKYTNFIRSLYDRPIEDEESFLTSREGTFYESTFKLANTNNTLPGKPMYLYAGLSLDVYGPSFHPSIPNGVAQIMASGTYAFKDEFAMDPKTIEGSQAISIAREGAFSMDRVRPTITGNYCLETTGSCDTKMYVYDSQNNQIGYDDDSGTGYNAKLILQLTAGQTYYVKTRLYSSSSTGSYSLSVYFTCNDIQTGQSASFLLANGSVDWRRFIPTISRSYTISLCRSGDDGDPELYLYDSAFQLIAYNDDYLDEDSRIVCSLSAGSTYYIKSKMTLDEYANTLILSVN